MIRKRCYGGPKMSGARSFSYSFFVGNLALAISSTNKQLFIVVDQLPNIIYPEYFNFLLRLSPNAIFILCFYFVKLIFSVPLFPNLYQYGNSLDGALLTRSFYVGTSGSSRRCKINII